MGVVGTLSAVGMAVGVRLLLSLNKVWLNDLISSCSPASARVRGPVHIDRQETRQYRLQHRYLWLAHLRQRDEGLLLARRTFPIRFAHPKLAHDHCSVWSVCSLFIARDQF